MGGKLNSPVFSTTGAQGYLHIQVLGGSGGVVNSLDFYPASQVPRLLLLWVRTFFAMEGGDSEFAKFTVPAYCVAANCNNSQTTPGITVHELPRNRPAVRRKWIKFIQFKRADFLAAPICVASTSVSAISQTPWNTAWGLLRS